MSDSIIPIQEKLDIYCVQRSTGEIFILEVWRDLLMAVQGVGDPDASLFYYLLGYLSRTAVYQEMFHLPWLLPRFKLVLFLKASETAGRMDFCATWNEVLDQK